MESTDDKARRVVLWWGVAGIVIAIGGAGYAANTFVSGKASAAEVDRLRQTIEDQGNRMSSIEATHQAESERLERIENKIDQIVDWAIGATTPRQRKGSR